MVSTDVTKRAITLGARNATTGWRAITYTLDATLHCIIQPRSQAIERLPPGYHANYDYIGYTQDSFAVGDQILDAASRYYLVQGVPPYPVGDSTDHYILALKWLTEWEAAPGAVTMASGLDDPRERMKIFIDNYCRVAQIVKDDDSTQATWAAIFDNPPYPLHLEFRHGTTPVQGLYVCGRAQSTPERGYDKTPISYNDDAIVDICTMDSTGCAGDFLAWRMERELRYQLEQNPTGSIRTYQTADLKHIDIGGMWMYDLQVHVNYNRAITA